MKISSGGIQITTAHTILTASETAGEGSTSNKMPGEPAADPLPWKWSWNATEQFAGNTTYAFKSTVATDGYSSGNFYFNANTGYGILMEQDVTAMKGNALAPWFNINEEDMTKEDGTSLTSGDLDSAVVSTEVGDGQYLTVVYSGYVPGTGFSSSDIGFGTLYWASEDRTLSIDDANDYSAVVNIDSHNIEGDLIYVTYDMEGSQAPTEGAANNWEGTFNNPRTIMVGVWGDAIGHVAINTEITLRGMIIWSGKTEAGNTNITMPIRTS